ncbi:MAG: hypothetical protein QOH01_1387 [Verrucomicrobiota bacterium]|jgi:hypothetical protein
MPQTVLIQPEFNPPQFDMKSFKTLIPIIVAVIAFFGSIWAAQITASATAKDTAAKTAKDTATETARDTATKTTNRAIQEEQLRTSGGTISASGAIINRIGRPYTVAKQGPGLIRIVFDTPFTKNPVALATPLREPPTPIIRVVEVDERSVLFTTRHYANNNPIDAAFSFMVLESVESHPVAP